MTKAVFFLNQNQAYRLLVKAVAKMFFPTLLNLAQKTLDKSIKKQCVLSLYLRLYIKTRFLSFNRMLFSQTLVKVSDMKREGIWIRQPPGGGQDVCAPLFGGPSCFLSLYTDNVVHKCHFNMHKSISLHM